MRQFLFYSETDIFVCFKPSTSVRRANNSNCVPDMGESLLIKMTESSFPMLKVTLMIYNNGQDILAALILSAAVATAKCLCWVC